jgi:hypothetical protein
MTGRYYLKVPRYPARNVTFERPWRTRETDANYERDTKACWHRFRFLCTSLHSDGLDYEVQFNLAGDNPHVLITASGTPVSHKRSGSAARALTLPAPLTADRCREHVLEAQWFLPENAARRNSATTHWRRRYARFQELAGMANDTLRAEVEFWREMELLSGQRQHFKPGRTDDGLKANDEVAA